MAINGRRRPRCHCRSMTNRRTCLATSRRDTPSSRQVTATTDWQRATLPPPPGARVLGAALLDWPPSKERAGGGASQVVYDEDSRAPWITPGMQV
jgi:hypothetical protein